jgi:hypothetical protein
MRFTQVRTAEQVDLQALHRIRDQLVASRTGLINQTRAFCLEYGIAIRQGAGLFRIDLLRVLADEENDLTPAMRRMLGELYADLGRLDQRIAAVTREIEGLAAQDDRTVELPKCWRPIQPVSWIKSAPRRGIPLRPGLTSSRFSGRARRRAHGRGWHAYPVRKRTPPQKPAVY